jgi:heme-degrading monooxygenase HmoA
MATMLIQFSVKDFNEWKKVFDTGDHLRTSNGELSHQIFQAQNDPNKVSALYQWDSQEKALRFSQSSELRSMMMQAGVQGMPEVSFLKEASK